MAKENKFAGELAIGLFVDGRYLRIVCLSRQKENIRLIDARSLVLAHPIESSSESEEILPAKDSIDLTPKDDSANAIDLELELDLPDKPSDSDSVSQTSTQQTDNENADSAQGIAADLTYLEENSQADEVTEIKAFGENDDEEIPVDIDFLLKPDSDLMQQTQDLTGLPEFTDSPELERGNQQNSVDDPRSNARNSSLKSAEFGENLQDNASLLHEILSHYPSKKYKVAISLPDPQTFYTYFNTDWGLNEKKLKDKVIEELSRERSDSKKIKTEAVNILRLADESLMVITRDAEVGILNLLETLKDSMENRLPKISFVESAEISLVNLVKRNYDFGEAEITVIIYVGHEFSRFIFMQGNLLLHISPIIGEGADSFLVFGASLSEFVNTIYSRLLLETDDLNLNKINNVILAGEAREAVLKSLLVDLFPEKVNIEEIKFVNLDTFGVSEQIVKMLPHTAIALGAAWRSLDETNPSLYQVNLIPSKIREEQKIFKLSAFGWILLALIPVFTLFFTKQFIEHDHELKHLKNQRHQMNAELMGLQKIKTSLDSRMEKLNYYTSTFGVLDSLIVGTDIWSQLLQKVAREAKQVGGIWLTELETLGTNSVLLKGYSLTRSKIPVFCNAIENATLQQVQVQEIRERTVYNFAIEARISKQSAETPTNSDTPQ